MNPNKKIWNLAKMRFLHGESSLWVIGNKSLEVLFFSSLATWCYFEFFSLSNLKYFGLVLAVLCFAEIRHRYGTYIGYFDGYEQGFNDAATKNLDYWGDTHSEISDARNIEDTMKAIEKNEDQVSAENKESREAEIKTGFGKLVGFILTWRRLR